MAKTHGVGVGAHPGYPDMQGFGRRFMDCTADEIRNYVIYQVGALMGFCAANGVKMRHVKPHGMLYNTAVENRTVAGAIVEAVASVDAGLMLVALAGPKGALISEMGDRLGIKVVFEAFPDRAYTPEGTLVSRRLPGAVISDPEQVAARALKIATQGTITAVDGTDMHINVQTLCVHGDNPTALELVKRVRSRLESEGVTVKPMGEE